MFVRRWKQLPSCASVRQALNIQKYSTEVKEAPKAAASTANISEYRTGETDTAKHDKIHASRFYTIPETDKKQLFSGGGLPKKFEAQVKTFAETCLMVRQPALEIIDYLKRMNFNNPTVRYVLCGENGVGKSLSMAHILHYGLQNKFVLVHVPWVPNWMKRPKEISTTPEGMIDLPFDAAAWLVHFKTQNATLLPTLDLRTSKDYVWSKRETTPAGSTLSELVEHGIARIKFASETVAALIYELKLNAKQDKCKVMVVIDGFNAFFHPETRILGDNKQPVTPDKITLTQPFLDITRYDWNNGVCILSVDKIAMTEGYMDSFHPRYLLGQKGFEHLDPFVPVIVTNYNHTEFKSCVDYYLDRQWIQKTPRGFDAQLKHMSNRNPYSLMELSRSL